MPRLRGEADDDEDPSVCDDEEDEGRDDGEELALTLTEEDREEEEGEEPDREVLADREEEILREEDALLVDRDRDEDDGVTQRHVERLQDFPAEQPGALDADECERALLDCEEAVPRLETSSGTPQYAGTVMP
ncbi:MAG: hypothetical protein Q7R81_05395, partial [Candidatus Peregrinibacteria bacterium]|nr:hypothetical protein [Candidatus Peregrinibacteria bacterium]